MRISQKYVAPAAARAHWRRKNTSGARIRKPQTPRPFSASRLSSTPSPPHTNVMSTRAQHGIIKSVHDLSLRRCVTHGIFWSRGRGRACTAKKCFRTRDAHCNCNEVRLFIFCRVKRSSLHYDDSFTPHNQQPIRRRFCSVRMTTTTNGGLLASCMAIRRLSPVLQKSLEPS